ncbi:insulin-degrading enzyme [Bicyclus anynana]|uniref:Insulin-degrading enzyme n=1 Tax=Bicyclus anynana TaxID=110368 RepID=A0A6J1N4B5_BICAN|nr:insulin-degrading enzyme [Bicyclus anynana]XP_052745521.1 insulin-degrading enzyme [Bicyclus anynana]
MTVPQCVPRSPSRGQSPAEARAGSGADSPADVVKKYDDIVKSQEDRREYRGLQLANNLKVLLVSDPTTDKSAAALDVNVGYLSDPDELPGLAHFCEHMLFLGTEKYPEENEYNKFLSEHGGSSNASTSSDHTTYYFDVLPQHLASALDMYVPFRLTVLMHGGSSNASTSSDHTTYYFDVLPQHLASALDMYVPFRLTVLMHGGSSNASTSSDHTTYYFDVLPQHLASALDMYVPFRLTVLMHGGSSNASTSSDHTTYYFDVLPQHLASALDMYVPFRLTVLMHGGSSNASTSSDHTTYYFDVLPQHLASALDMYVPFRLTVLMHGGSSNASTSSDHTTYYFDVLPQHLASALDMYVPFRLTVLMHGGSSNASTSSDHTTYYFDVLPQHLASALDMYVPFRLTVLMHGGSSNASTSSDHTTYYFDVLPQHLASALDMYVPFRLTVLMHGGSSNASTSSDHTTYYFDVLPQHLASALDMYVPFRLTVLMHGGSSNASTSSDHTTYYFDVLPQHLASALDIFAQFFISPLFTESATGRELSAVNSEHEKNASSDMWRLDQLNKSTADPQHPFHKFGTGNRDTLETTPKEKGIDVRKELLKFHQQWYSANIMTLVVMGKESLDSLESMVVRLFSAVEDRRVAAPAWAEHPFPPALRRKRAYCVPVKDLRSLSIDFPIPDTRKHYKSGPGQYISHLLGHEGPGSLLAALKARGWCNSLVGGTRIGARGFGFFGVQVDLTEEGVKHTDEIVELVFQYIAMLKAEGAKKWVWEEQRDLMAMEFRFKDAQEPRALVVGHVHLLQEFPMQDIMSAYYLLTDWRPDLIDELLALLTPDNVRVGVVAKCFEHKCTNTERWYGTKYLQEDIEEARLNEWKAAKPTEELHLPPPNEFIPTKLDLEKSPDPTTDTIAPVIIKDTPLMRLWYKRDNEFMLPKAFITLDLVSPLAYADPASCNLTSVWVLLLRDSLQQFAYAAELAGLRWSVGNAKYGLSITVDGYDDKQHVLLEKLIEHVVQFTADPQRFHIMKESHIRAIKNFEAEQPYQHAVYQQALSLSDLVWTRSQLVEAAENITAEQLNEFAARLVRKVHVEGLMFGNITRERALAIATAIEDRLPKDATPLLAQQLLLYREVEIEKGAWYLRETENAVHKSSCASLYYACGVRQTRANVTLELLAQALSEPCFHVLRTQEQLGYIVFSGVRRSNGVQGLRVIVQSERHPAYLEDRIESFIAGSQDYLEKMTEEEFLKHRSSLAAQRLERPKRLSSKASQLWSEITAQVYNFDRPHVEVDELNTVTKQELIDFFKKHVSPQSADRQKLSVYVVSTAEGGAGKQYESQEKTENSREPVKIQDLVDFKSRRRLYPHPAPYASIPRKGAHCKL